MLRNNCTKLKIENIIVILIMSISIVIFGMILSKSSNTNLSSMSKSKNIKIETKTFEANVDDNLVAFSDNISLQISEATPEEKISSRASNARRSRGEEKSYISIEQVSISRDMNLNNTTGLSKEDFITLISNVKADTSGFFKENAGMIYDLCQIYSINEIFFCGLISAESGWNIASNHRRTFNYISLMSSSGGLIQFSSVENGLEAAAIALHNNYLTPGGKFYKGSTLEGVRTIFCPVNPGWTELVFGRMAQII